MTLSTSPIPHFASSRFTVSFKVFCIIIPASSDLSLIWIPFSLFSFYISYEIYSKPLPSVIMYTGKSSNFYPVRSLRTVIVVNLYVLYRSELSSFYKRWKPYKEFSGWIFSQNIYSLNYTDLIYALIFLVF